MTKIGDYRVPDLSRWDWYNLNYGDDIAASVDLVDDVPVNELIPFPADAEDPDEALLVKELEIAPLFVGKSGVAGIDSTTTPQTEIFTLYLGFFEFDEVDETTAAYRDEIKEAIAQLTYANHEANQELTTNDVSLAANFDIQPKRIIFERPMVFPLNPSIKCELQGDNSPSLVFQVAEDWEIKLYYRVVRSPMDFLGRILMLMRQELSG